MHLFFLNRMTVLSEVVFEDILFKFIVTIVLSISIAYIFNLSKYGKYLIGNINRIDYEKLHKNIS